jgi:hypothetical protein
MLPRHRVGRKATMIEDIKKFFGITPYNGPENILRGDGYFKISIEKKYGDSIENLRKKAGL